MKKLLSIFVLLLGLGLGQASAVSATGGSIVNYTEGGTNWIAHIFTNAATTNIVFSEGGYVEYFVVAGGGSGGRVNSSANHAGGGGAGGLLRGSTNILAQTYGITVGIGGVARTTDGATGAKGSNSVFDLIVADGGGGGTSYGGTLTDKNGASGGGASAWGTAGTGISGQGYAGGSDGDSNPNGAGGGGAGSVGGNSSTNNGGTGGDGGYGVFSYITGRSLFYAGGGGAPGNTVMGAGGAGVGGVGMKTGSGTTIDGLNGTGSGGGGVGNGTSGKGGSGIVVIRYQYSGTPIEYFVSTNGNDSATGLDWANALLTISNAVAKAANFDIITVSNGTYNISTQINLTAANVTLRSFGNGVTGGISNASNTIVKVSGGVGNRRIFNITTIGTTVDGFTIRDSARASGTMLGGGIYMSDGTVQNCIITNCSGDTVYGSGAYMDGGRLLNSYILGNGGSDRTRGGGVYVNNISAVVDGCVIRGNASRDGVSYGGGVILTAGLIVNCTIDRNSSYILYGAGVYMTGGIVRNCVISKNYSVYNGLAYNFLGAGVYMTGGELESSTIVNNTNRTVIGSGTGVYRAGGTVRNCIILNNITIASDRIDNYSGLTSADTSFTDTIPSFGGVSNVALDQVFVDPSNDNYRLKPGPAMDSGINMPWMIGAVDIGGNPRTNGVDNRVDMGAYEYVPSALQCGFAVDFQNVLVSSNAIFTAYVAGTNTTVTNFIWDFGDGNTISSPSRVVTNAYSSAGVYSVSLLVTNSALETCATTNSNCVTVWPTITYVRTNNPSSEKPYTTWATASTNINSIANFAPNGVTIICTNGTYNEMGTVILNNRITLTSVDGGLSGASNTIIRQAFNIVLISSINNANAVVAGLTFRDGAGTSTGYGRGMSLLNGTVRNCIIRNNGGDNVPGKGILMSGGLVSNCIITANNIGGGTPDGAGIYATAGLIVNSDISDNIGAARNGCGVYLGGATLRGCLIRNNKPSGLGGGVYLASGSIESCTIVSNSASAAGGGGGVFRVSGTAGTISNSIVYLNTASASVYSNIYTTTTNNIRYVCTTNPVVAGLGCISANPLFVSLTDWSLQSSSPCIGVGSVQPWMTSTFDLAGNPRLTGALVDIGAYEFFAGGVIVIVPWRMWQENQCFQENQAIGNGESGQ